MSKIKLQCKLYMAIQTKKRSSDTSQNRIQAKSNSKKKKRGCFIQQIFTKHLSYTRHHARGWGYMVDEHKNLHRAYIPMGRGRE